MILVAKIYLGIGLLVILLKCIAVIWFNHGGIHLTNEGVLVTVLNLVLDLIIWPFDLVYIYKIITDPTSEEDSMDEALSMIILDEDEKSDIIKKMVFKQEMEEKKSKKGGS